MKQNIHPKYHEIKITCSCGNTFVTGTTLDADTLSVDICSKCHPFYTGEQKIVDTDNLVKRYEERVEKAKGMSFQSKRAKMEARRRKDQEMASKPTATLSLRDMLENAKFSK